MLAGRVEIPGRHYPGKKKRQRRGREMLVQANGRSIQPVVDGYSRRRFAAANVAAMPNLTGGDRTGPMHLDSCADHEMVSALKNKFGPRQGENKARNLWSLWEIQVGDGHRKVQADALLMTPLQ
jgi:hypothetical protein